MNSLNTDFLIIGAGVVGLSLGRALLMNNPKISVHVIEKEAAIGMHASGRNSGVIHAGFYYSPDSLKAKLTRKGNLKLHDFLEKKNVPYKNCGKVVVASNSQEQKLIFDLYDRGMRNDVPLKIIDRAELKKIEPQAKTFEYALWSPSTSVANPKKVIDALAEDFKELGGHIILEEKITSFEKKAVLSTNYKIYYEELINCAGLYADQIAHKFGEGLEYEILPFKGLYWYAPNLKGKFSCHIYPTPHPKNPFLGTHLTVTEAGDVKIGPTAIPALWRENYRGMDSYDKREMFDILKIFPKFIFSKKHNALNLLISEIPKYNKKLMVSQARKIIPTLNSSDFTILGKPGIRAQLFNKKEAQLEMDFVVRKTDNSLHILNAVSPGWTSALSFADYIVEQYF